MIAFKKKLKPFRFSCLISRKYGFWQKITDSGKKIRILAKITEGGLLIWVIIADELITLLKSEGLSIVGYADAVAIMVSGMSVITLKEQMNKAFKIVEKWSTKTGLDVTSEKTEMILFTNKHVFKGNENLTETAAY